MLRFEKFDDFGDFDDDVDVDEAAFCKLVPVYFMACDRRWKVQSDNYYSDCAHPHPIMMILQIKSNYNHHRHHGHL